MLAEMFILRLEAIKQDSRDFGFKQYRQFVPFTRTDSFAFKDKRPQK
jgi:hypothetical protein